MREKLLLIHNPISGGKGKEFNRRLQSTLAKFPRLDSIYTEYPGHARKIVEHTMDKYDGYIVAGGDGTINEVASPIVNTSKKLAVIPRGSANGFAFHHGIPFDLTAAMQTALSGRVKQVDAIYDGTDYIFNCGGIGFDGLINKIFNTTSTRGLWSYVRLIFSEFLRFREFDFELTVDGRHESGKAFIIVLANTKQYGHNFLFAPNASTEDGRIHLSIIRKPPFLSLPYLLYTVKKGNIGQSKYFQERSGENIRIVAPGQEVHFDGEQISQSSDQGVNLQVMPGALNLIC